MGQWVRLPECRPGDGGSGRVSAGLPRIFFRFVYELEMEPTLNERATEAREK